MKGKGIIGSVLPLMALIVICGCTKKIYVPVESRLVMTDSVRIATIRRDSVWLKDSVFVSVRGDTVIKESYRWRTRDRFVIDTVYKERRDTVKVTVVKEIPVEKAEKRSLFRRMADGLLSILAVVGVVAVIVAAWRRWWRGKKKSGTL